jgi:hypothetical protein
MIFKHKRINNEMDGYIKDHIEWLKRLSEMPRIHYGGLGKCEDELTTCLRAMINRGKIQEVRKAYNILCFYSNVIIECKKRDPMKLWKLEQCLIDIKTLLNVSTANEPVITIILSGANWSHRSPIVGKVIYIRDINEVDFEKLMELKDGYLGKSLYLLRERPSVTQLSNWPDTNSLIISASGGSNSEEMNYAKAGGTQYINGAEKYFTELIQLNGEVVSLLPS